MSLSKRDVIIVGGTGGIGSEVTRILAAANARVTATFRANAARAREFRSLGRVAQADLGVAEERSRLIHSVDELYGLVVMAGDPARASASETPEETMQRSHNVNFAGPILLARETADMMRKRGTPGAIVLVSTMQAAGLFPGSTMYAAEKAALVHAARILAKETRGPSGIRVNVVSPGIIEAGMAKASISSGKYNHYLEDGTLPRFGTPHDIARAVRFLLEPDNYITGQVLCIDGGITL